MCRHVLRVEAVIPVSLEIRFTPKLHESLVVSKGPVVVSLEVSISSLSSSRRRQNKKCYANIVLHPAFSHIIRLI